MPKSTFTDRYNRQIELSFDEDELKCSATFEGEKIGEFSFRPFDDEDSLTILLTHCHLEDMPGFKRCGIGTAILRLVNDYGYTVLARPNDGVIREDGSHLTENAPAFVSRMHSEGLVHQLNSGEDDTA